MKAVRIFPIGVHRRSSAANFFAFLPTNSRPIPIHSARCYDSRFTRKEVPMVSRRAFLQSSAVYGAAAAVYADTSKPTGFFGVHPFVDQHPEAVFILRTHVDRKTNSEACKR